MKKINYLPIFMGLFGVIFCLIFTGVLIKLGIFSLKDISWSKYTTFSFGPLNTTINTGEKVKTSPYMLLSIILPCLTGSLMAISMGLKKENLTKFFFGLVFLSFGIAFSFFFSPVISGICISIGTLIIVGCTRQFLKRLRT